MLDETRFAAARRAFQDHGQAVRVGMGEECDFVAGRAIERFVGEAIRVDVGEHEAAIL
jgi:hypothetical protein